VILNSPFSEYVRLIVDDYAHDLLIYFFDLLFMFHFDALFLFKIR
jgi:hypothetical protein